MTYFVTKALEEHDSNNDVSEEAQITIHKEPVRGRAGMSSTGPYVENFFRKSCVVDPVLVR